LKTCHLTRDYSVTSLVGIVLVAMVIVYLYQSMAVKALMERESDSNSDLARTIGNSLWPKYADFVGQAGDLSLEQLAGLPVIEKIRQDILHKVDGLRVVKVKIYDLNGLVVFSTQAAQIGSNRGDNTGFLSARDGLDASEIIFRDSFSSFEGSIYDRNLVASYVPVRRSFDGPVEGVFEIYSDVTPLLADIDHTSNRILIFITSLMLLLYLFLLIIVRRAHLLLQAHEVAEQREQQQRLDYLEFHDEVTGLLNRKGLLRQLQRYEMAERLNHVGLGVIALKLLNLNGISGGLGPQRVMHLLRLAAERLQSCAAGSHNLSYLNSSEFILVVENLFSADEMDFLVEKLINLFAEPFAIDGKSVTFTIAIGVDSSWGDKSGERLVSRAQLALDECESRGGKKSLHYDESMELKKRESLDLEVDISHALQRREFVLYYQPKIDAVSGKVTGMEALVRWEHPHRGLVMPGGFIPLLEERGYIVELGGWVVREACMQCERWHQEGRGELRVAVNVSLKQLQSKGFVESVAGALQQSGLPPRALELELTESILAEDTATIGEQLQQLKSLGVMLAIDDFGTGYSSLSYLMHYPFDFIKIDRSFIRDMMHNRNHSVLTRAIVTMAKSLRLGVVAEGVETPEQLARVREMGCDEIQGFYFSQAVEATRFTEVISGINASAPAYMRQCTTKNCGTQSVLPAMS
jgi:EAL domain-containing protein (putative c-di-GMP-specific phosphodiesterase class I)/GGDEF domain-containing protein